MKQRQSSITLSPFQAVTCLCIICEQQASYNKVRPTLYTEKKRDIVLKPIAIDWSAKVSQKIDPKLFYFWQCPYCLFTADFNFFIKHFGEGGMSASRFRKMFVKARESNPQLGKVTEILKIDVEKEKSLFIVGLKRNLYAIYCWELVDEIVNGDCLLLASYYLRLSWMLHDLRLFRSKKSELFSIAQQLIRDLMPYWPKICKSEGEALNKSYGYYQQALSKSPTINTVLQEIQVRLIMVRILMKLGKLEDAKAGLNVSKTRVSSYSSAVQKKLTSSDKFDDDLREMERGKTAAQELLLSVEIIYEKLEAARREKIILKAKKVLENMKDKSYEEKLAKLKNQGFADNIIKAVLPPPKKRWFFDRKKAS